MTTNSIVAEIEINTSLSDLEEIIAAATARAETVREETTTAFLARINAEAHDLGLGLNIEQMPGRKKPGRPRKNGKHDATA